jgi:2-polyprenyl-3-methyl-5-hydroxy-6-metoxy-1,4-benzoquinol methylase
VAEISSEEYLEYLVSTYTERPESYYRDFLKLPLVAGQDILDWGCGLGRMLEVIADSAPARLAGLDVNPECVRYVKARHPDWQVELLALPGLRAPFPESSFDRIFLLDVLEHVHEPDTLLAECHRLLRPGGILTLSTPDRLAFHKLADRRPFGLMNLSFNIRHLLGRVWVDPTHVTEWTASGLRNRLEASPFAYHDFRPSLWHFVPWARPPRRYYAFTVNLFKASA